MITVYVYILDTLADWEMGYATAELNSKRFFKKDAPNISVKTVGISKEPVKTMGGLTIIPDCAICGASAALANVSLLDQHLHTSNGMGYLEMVSPCYKGQQCYVDKPSVADQNLITASSTGALLWAKQIIERLEVFQTDTLEAWYNYFSSGKEQHFFALMQTLPANK